MISRHLSFHYTLRDRSGKVIDTSRGGAPLACVEGAGQIVEGLETALRAMAPGEKRVVVVAPGQGYGERDPDLVQRVPRAQLPVADVRVGDQFQTAPDPQAPIVTIVGVEGDQVLLDANHPLAGVELHFEVELVSARPATPAELPAPENPA